MTHYMELLAANQPWNLLVFMAVPMVLAETVAVTELYLLHTKRYVGTLRRLNAVAAVAGGAYFLAVAIYLLVTVAIPVTRAGDWRGGADVVVVGFYLFGAVPFLGIALIKLGVLGSRRTPQARMGLHAGLVALFLVTAHVAMISGMLDPAVFSAGTGQNASHHASARHGM